MESVNSSKLCTFLSKVYDVVDISVKVHIVDDVSQHYLHG